MVQLCVMELKGHILGSDSRATILLVVAVICFVGCNRENSHVVGNPTNLWEMADGEVIFKVNGFGFTKSDFMAASRMYDRINRLNAGDDLFAPNVRAEKAVKFRAPLVLSEMVRRAQVRCYAKENNIEPTEEDLQVARRTFERQFRRRQTIEKIADQIGSVEGRIMLDYMRGDALDMTLRKRFDTEHTFDITDADVMVVSNRIIRFNETAAVSNAFEKSVLTKALADIGRGESFGSVARKYSKNPEEGVTWSSFSDGDFDENPALFDWVKSAKVGDISGILETDEGWIIAKMTDSSFQLLDDEGNGSREWTLVRILRPLWEKAAAMKREEIVDGVLKYRQGLVQKRVWDAIAAHSTVEWPYGTNVLKCVGETVVQRPVAAKESDLTTKEGTK